MADLNSLMIFAKVVEANSFSEAARRLKIPISTVSRRVAELEDLLSVRLLERSTHNLRLTDVGAEVLEHAQQRAELSEAVDNLVSNQLSTVAGVLRLSAPPKHLRHPGRTAARRVPGIVPEHPCTGFGHRSVCRPYRRGDRSGVSLRRT